MRERVQVFALNETICLQSTLHVLPPPSPRKGPVTWVVLSLFYKLRNSSFWRLIKIRFLPVIFNSRGYMFLLHF